LVDLDELGAAEPVAVQQTPGNVAGLGTVDSVDTEVAGSSAVAGTWRRELPQCGVADAGMRQAYVTEDGRVAEGFVPEGSATAEPPMDVGATPGHGYVAERAAAQPAAFPYANLPTSALGATFVDPGSVSERELGTFEILGLPLQRAERPLTPVQPGAVPVAVSAYTFTTTTVTFTVATSTAVVGPVYSSYFGYAPTAGPAMAHAVQPAAVVSQTVSTLIDTVGSFPEA